MNTTQKHDLNKIPVRVFTDAVFFHKSQVKTGSRFICFGRTNFHTTWVVNSITHIFSEKRRMFQTKTAFVYALKDIVELRCEETGEFKKLRFSYLSYSAIYRLI
jgi:hypothetical protein